MNNSSEVLISSTEAKLETHFRDRLEQGFDEHGPILMWRQHGYDKPCEITREINNAALDDFVERVRPYIMRRPPIPSKAPKGAKAYFDEVAILDIESSNLDNFRNENPNARICGACVEVVPKCANMVIWMFALCGVRIFGRTWNQFHDLRRRLDREFDCAYARIKVGVHNFGFEFSFLHKVVPMERVFALSSHKPIRADDGIFEYYDTLALSCSPLAKLELIKHKVEKLVGDWDYNKIRHYLTPLTDKELAYCDNDVKKPSAWVAEKLEKTVAGKTKDGETRGYNIADMPMTSTGFIRKDLLEQMREEDAYEDFAFIKASLRMSFNDYLASRHAYRGGSVIVNDRQADKIVYGVEANDIGSAHPGNIVMGRFPMGKFRKKQISKIEDAMHYIKHYACLFKIRLWNVDERVTFAHPLVESTCVQTVNATKSNGKLVRADYAELWVNEIQFKLYCRCYKFSRIEIDPKSFRYTRKDYLPRKIIKAVLEYFKLKTTLKDIPEDIAQNKYGWDKETAAFFYALYKTYINGVYGNFAMDPVRPEWCFNGANSDWYDAFKEREGRGDAYHALRLRIGRVKGFRPKRGDRAKKETKKRDTSEDIRGVNTDKKRYTFYPWAGWVTAYTTQQLFMPILGLPREELIAQGMPEDMCPGRKFIGLGDDFVYCDTDCDKYISRPEYVYLFEAVNARMTAQLRQACAARKIPFDDARPEKPDGTPCQIGLYEFDGYYTQFKTLGAKRYACIKTAPLSDSDEDKAAYMEDLDKLRRGEIDESQARMKRELETTVAGTGKFSKKNLDFDISHYKNEEIDWSVETDPIPYDPKPCDRLPQLLSKINPADPLAAFTMDLVIPAEYTGKLTHTYGAVDGYVPITGKVTDRFGITATVSMYSWTHLGPQDYKLSDQASYLSYLATLDAPPEEIRY